MISENILILTYWSYEDALTQAHVMPYVKIIRKNLANKKNIWIQTLEIDKHKDERIKIELENNGLKWISSKYYKFGSVAAFNFLHNIIKLIILCKIENIKVIHVWCTPIGVLGYILSLLTGAKLIIDSYEPHAESMVENKTWKKNSIKYRILIFFEKQMTRRAEIVISLTQDMKEYAKITYGFYPKILYVKPSCIDLNIFNLKKNKNELLLNKYNLKDKIVMVYAGKIGGIYLEQELFDFLKIALKVFGENFRFLLLSQISNEKIEKYCENSGINKDIIILKYVNHNKISEYIGMADFAITPVKSTSSKRYCSPLKNGEYWAVGLPIIITNNISDDSNIIEKENIGAVIKNLNELDYYNAAIKMKTVLMENKETLNLKIHEIAKKYRNFNIAKEVYSRIYN